jgi:CHAT domain-containing protein/Tfp pilus assembly protein PilF
MKPPTTLMGRTRLVWKLFLLAFTLLPLETAAATPRGRRSGGVRLDTRLLPRLAGQQGPLQREMRGGETHRYSLRLATGQYVSIVIRQLGIDVVPSLFDPKGRKLIESDTPTANYGSEVVRWMAHAGGSYRLELRSFEKDTVPGCYEIWVEASRIATPNDRILMAAEVAFAEAYRLDQQQNAASERRAVDKFLEALALFRRGGDLAREALSLDYAGVERSAIGEYSAALDHFEEALLMSRAAGDEAVEGHALFMMGTIETSISRASAATRHYEEALSIERRMGDRSMEAEILSNFGRLQDSLGEKSTARNLYERALAVSRDTRNHELEIRLLNRLGALYQSLGEKAKALSTLRQALLLVRSRSDKTLEALVLSSLARLFTELGDSDRALRGFGEALAIVRRNGDRHTQAAILFDMGQSRAVSGNDSSALEDFSAALPIVRAVSDPRLEAAVLNASGNIYARSGHVDQAFALFDEGLAVARKTKDPYREADLLTSRGALLGRAGRPEEGLEELRRAILLRRTVANSLGEAASAYESAVIENGRLHFEQARAFVETAIGAVESVRGRLPVPELRASFLGSVQKYYELDIDLLMNPDAAAENGDLAAEALQMSERAKARTLLDLLTEAGADIRTGINPELLERQRSLRQRLKARIGQQIRTSGESRSDQESARLASEIDSVTDELQEIEAQVRETSPRYAALTQPKPLDLSGIQRETLDEATLLLEYALGDRRSFLWAVSPGSLKSFVLPPRAEIEEAARRAEALWRSEGAAPVPSRTTKAWREAETLSRMVLGPVAGLLGTKRLLIVADGALLLVPFAALPVPGAAGGEAGGPVLIDEHEIVSLPSASVLALQRRELAERAPAAKTLAVLADPVFERDDIRLRERRGRDARLGQPGLKARHGTGLEAPSLAALAAGEGNLQLSRLSLTRREAKAILRLVPPSERKEALDFAASVATARSQDIAGYRFLHFATHGLISGQHPELSGIVLSLFDRDGREQEGFLSTPDVLNLKLPVELVVLSACRTGLGREIRGEGFVGLARAFMYAGAARVVASLWKVDDAATAELMTRFYEGMLGPRRLTPAAALREAQTAVKRQKRWEHPSYWAAFTLQGEWN